VPHITLKSIARNTSLDPIFAKHEPILAEKLALLNSEVVHGRRGVEGETAGQADPQASRTGGECRDDADIRRWLLPDTQQALIKSIPARKPLKGVTPKQAQAYRDAIPKGGWRNGKSLSIPTPTGRKPLRRR
jgi:adenine-specific DNA-methyltransferase